MLLANLGGRRRRERGRGEGREGEGGREKGREGGGGREGRREGGKERGGIEREEGGNHLAVTQTHEQSRY